MDPQPTWDDLLAAYADGDWEGVDELAEALSNWLDRGGFPPRATTGSDLGQDWDVAIARAACQFARSRAREEVS
jgi:hypothetical protein